MQNIQTVTGYCLNYCDSFNPDKFDLFVIFNEGWGIPPREVIDLVDETMYNYIAENSFDGMENYQISFKMMDLFTEVLESNGIKDDWGCQVYIRSRK